MAADVLVVGAGAAGLRAALAAGAAGATVLVVAPGPVTASGVSVSSVGACAAVAGGADSPGAHASDTLAGGRGLSDGKILHRFVADAERRTAELESIGVFWDRTPDGRLAQHALPGHRHARSLTVGMRTGAEIVAALHAALLARPGVRIAEGLLVGDLRVTDGVVNGAVAVGDEGVVVIEAGAVVLATGGVHGLYGSSSIAGPDLSGDGLALALRAGADLVDLEFVQYFPTAMVWPPALAGNIWVGELRYRCGAWLTNSQGERFMKRHDATNAELATRDLVSRAIALEIAEGRGTPHGGVWLSAAHAGADSLRSFLAETFPDASFTADDLLAAGVDIRTDALEVAPVVHFHMGGVRVGSNAMTKVPGLFAAGEVASGLHGANRLENNALTETQVFGAIAGEGAARFAREGGTPRREADMPGLTAADPVAGERVTSRVQQIMTEEVGLLRHAAGLRKAIAEMNDLRNESTWRTPDLSPAGVRTAWRVRNATVAGEAMARAALARTESRGAHYRLDHPRQDDARWLTHVVVSSRGEDLVLREDPVP